MTDAFTFGPFCLSAGRRVLRKDGAVVALGSRAFDLLVAMVERGGAVLTPAELMAIAWPGVAVEDSNLRVQIARLRRTLGCGRNGARYIANVAGRGYCFVAPVQRIADDASGRPASTPDTRTSSSVAATGPRPHSGVPPPLSGAIGRDACVTELSQIVNERRLVTVVGAAGAGKTTLAILVAHARHGIDGSVAFVDLSGVGGDDMVADALATAVGYVSAGGDFVAGLIQVLATEPALIVLDNCEHVSAAVAQLCQRIIDGTSTVSFLNTSREALRTRDEFVYLLRPLASPPPTGPLTAQQAMTWPAVQLFMERARDGGARSPLNDDEAAIVAGLCRRLDGNPHAIGLVASRVGAYGLQGVADLFEHQVALHWPGRRDAVPRHQTVEALIDWSHQLLTESDRQVLHRLSVFSGWFTLEAATAVVADDAIDAMQVGDAIGGLVDLSLVVSQHDGGTQIRLLETTRAYAASRLARRKATDEFASRHARYCAVQLRQFARSRLEPQAGGARLPPPDLGNVRAALEWASADGHDPALAAEISGMVAPLLLERGLIRECTRTCERALRELPNRLRSTRVELGLLDAAAVTYYTAGDYDGALRPVIERGLVLSRQLGDDRTAFHFLAGLHLALMANGEFRQSLQVCDQYAAAAAVRGGPTEAVISGWMEGSSRHYAGDQTAAAARFSASAQQLSRHEPRPLHYFESKEQIIARIGLARATWALGQRAEALRLAATTIDDGRAHPDSFYMCVTLCFHILLGSGHDDEAARLIDELESVAIDYKVAVRRQVIDVLKGLLLLRRGELPLAIGHLRACLAMLPPPRMSVVRTDALHALAQALHGSGDGAGALAAIDEAIELARKTSGIFNLADLLQTRAAVIRP